MIRFLILCTVFVLLYLGFNVISEYDSPMQFFVFDYQVQTTLFIFTTIFIAIQLILMISLKLVFLVFNFPEFLKKSWYKRRLIKTNQRLLAILSELLMGNKRKAISLTNKLVPDLDKENKEIISLIKTETEANLDAKIQHLRSLLDKKYYSIYAAKKLSEILYQNKHYKQAEECALKAFNEDDTDTELMLILVRVYASQGAWHKLVFIISKLQRADIKLLEQSSAEISGYYYAAAKSQIQSGDDDNALNYLESALELRPDYLEALNLFIDLSTNLQNTASILKVLKAAFSIKPCFEIARMYVANSRNSPEANYGILAGMAAPVQYPDLFLALAAYLGLPDKMEALKLVKPISDDPLIEKPVKTKRK